MIASEADAAKNSLVTGTLTASEAGKAAIAEAARAQAAAATAPASPQDSAPIVADPAASLAQSKANYEAVNGVGSYDKLIAASKAEDEAIVVRTQAWQSQFDKEMICVLTCPAMVVAVPAAGIEGGAIVTAKLGGGMTVNVLATGSISGTLNVGATYGTNYLVGKDTTSGDAVGSLARVRTH